MQKIQISDRVQVTNSRIEELKNARGVVIDINKNNACYVELDVKVEIVGLGIVTGYRWDMEDLEILNEE